MIRLEVDLDPCYARDGGILELTKANHHPCDRPIYFPHGPIHAKEAIWLIDRVHYLISDYYRIDFNDHKWGFTFSNDRDALLFKLASF